MCEIHSKCCCYHCVCPLSYNLGQSGSLLSIKAIMAEENQGACKYTGLRAFAWPMRSQIAGLTLIATALFLGCCQAARGKGDRPVGQWQLDTQLPGTAACDLFVLTQVDHGT